MDNGKQTQLFINKTSSFVSLMWLYLWPYVKTPSTGI